MPAEWEQLIANVSRFWQISPLDVWNLSWTETEWLVNEAARIVSP